jgi:hypothetical protein
MICARIDTSRAEPGSSSTMGRVCVASALAIAIRCRYPPLNSCGNSPATSDCFSYARLSWLFCPAGTVGLSDRSISI